MAATLADSFLADLDELDDDEDMRDAGGAGAAAEGAAELVAALTQAVQHNNLDSAAPLVNSDRYRRIMQEVDVALGKADVNRARTGPLEDDPEYKLIVECNALTVDIDNDIAMAHNFIRDRYRSKFPELESLVLHPVDYARVVKAIGNEMDTTQVDLEGVLPSATIMVVSVTGSTTNGQPLAPEVLEATLQACDRALLLDDAKRRVLRFVESRMAFIAPNLSAVVGTQVAAQLMGIAGGLAVLSRMPACNVQVLGAKRKTANGFSTASAVRAGDMHAGFIFGCDIIQQTPPALRAKACRLIGSKCTLMARMDAFGEDPAGHAGQEMRAVVVKKIEKWQEPPPAKLVKPLPVPDLEPKKRRGGRRLRKMKERYGLTDVRKAANRMNFNQAEEEVGLEGVGVGVVGAEGAGRLRMNTNQSKKLQKDAAKYAMKKFGNSGAASGLSSSLAFTPVQGIELANPNKSLGLSLGTGSGTDSVFNEGRGFSKVARDLRIQ